MDRWKRIVAIGLLALWAPATVHCLLESLLPATVLACNDHPDGRPHQSPECQDDACHAVESADYCLGGRDTFVHPPTARTFPAMAVSIEGLPAPESSVAGKPAFVRAGSPPPPWVAASVHFILRAAPSPRAPSCFV